MKTKTKHRKSYKWKKKADSSPVAKGRRVKRHGVRNPRKRKHLGGAGLTGPDPAPGADPHDPAPADGPSRRWPRP